MIVTFDYFLSIFSSKSCSCSWVILILLNLLLSVGPYGRMSLVMIELEAFRGQLKEASEKGSEVCGTRSHLYDTAACFAGYFRQHYTD